MAKYIDADHLKVEIEKHIKEVKDAGKRLTPNMGFFDAKLSGIYDVIAIIDSLQQEQTEVDLRNEINRFLSNATMMNKGEWKGKYPISEMGFGVVARHFFNLGLNARKEENK